ACGDSYPHRLPRCKCTRAGALSAGPRVPWVKSLSDAAAAGAAPGGLEVVRAQRAARRQVDRGLDEAEALVLAGVLHLPVVGHAGAELRLLDEAIPEHARLLAGLTVAIAERRRPMHCRGGAIIERGLLLAVGRKDRHHEGDEDAGFQDRHGWLSTL